MNTREVVNELCAKLRDPNEVWVRGLFSDTLIHRCGIYISVDAVLPAANTFPVQLRVGLYERWRLWRAFNVAQTNIVARQLKGQQE